jgi:hypothetical protein
MPLPFSLTHINLWAVRDAQGWAIFDTDLHTHATVQAWGTLIGTDAPMHRCTDAPLGESGLSRILVTHMHRITSAWPVSWRRSTPVIYG